MYLALESIRLAIGPVFLLSAFGKLRDWSGFIRGVVAYQILPTPLATIYGILLVPLEALVGGLLVTGLSPTIGAMLGLCMLLSFFVAVSINIQRRRVVPCYCFGASSQERVSARTLARIGLLSIGLLLVLLGTQVFKVIGPPNVLGVGTNSWTFTTMVTQGTLVLFTLVIGLWMLALPDLLKLRRKRIR